VAIVTIDVTVPSLDAAGCISAYVMGVRAGRRPKKVGNRIGVVAMGGAAIGFGSKTTHSAQRGRLYKQTCEKYTVLYVAPA
jgi:hypothetical protein